MDLVEHGTHRSSYGGGAFIHRRADPAQADAVWQLWFEGRIDDVLALVACLILAG